MNKSRTTQYNPDDRSPPGETLAELLEMHSMTQAELADRMGRPKKTINEIIRGRAAITPETALQLELVFRVPAHFWLTLEANYQVCLARKEEHDRLEQDGEFLKELPLKVMESNGWIGASDDKREQTKSALSYFGVVNSTKIPIVQEAAFRAYHASTSSAWSLAAWLRKGELDAQQIRVEDYDRDRFTRTLQKIRSLTTESPTHFAPLLTQMCARSGVSVVFVKDLPQAAATGATRWLGGHRPLIQLSTGHRTDDAFWFAFFHQSGHIILEHAKREVILDFAAGNTLDPREVSANQFARNILIPETKPSQFLTARAATRAAIEQFAETIDIAPGIVVRRLQQDNVLAPNQFNSLKRTLDWTNAGL